MILDVIWFIVACYTWNKVPDREQFLWDSLSGVHTMALFFSFINILIRVWIHAFI